MVIFMYIMVGILALVWLFYLIHVLRVGVSAAIEEAYKVW